MEAYGAAGYLDGCWLVCSGYTLVRKAPWSCETYQLCSYIFLTVSGLGVVYTSGMGLSGGILQMERVSREPPQ